MENKIVLAILVVASALTMMSTDLYAPSMAHLPEILSTTPEMVQLTISVNAIAYGLATLVHGPLAERFGRKPVLVWGIILFALSSFFCAISDNIGQLLVARVLQGITAAVEGVVVLAIIKDLFDQKDQVKAIAIYGVATALAPAFAPIIGGYVHVLFGWRMNFHILTWSAVVVALLVIFLLRESGEPDPHALRPREILRDYLALVSNVNYMRYITIGGCCLACIFAFITAGPFILINNHGVPTQYYGIYQGVLVVAYVLGSITAGKMVKYGNLNNILMIAAVAAIVGAISLAVVVYGGYETAESIVITVGLIAYADGLFFAVVPALAMAATKSRTGPAAALLLAAEMCIGSFAAFAVGTFHDGTAEPMTITMIVLCVIIVVGYLTTPKEELMIKEEVET